MLKLISSIATKSKRSLVSKTIVFGLLLVLSFVSLRSDAQVSLTFSSGYLGTQASATQQTSNIKNLSTLGIARVSFSQTYPGTFGGTQGNDLSGIIRLYMNSGQVISLNGALNWRETTGNSLDVFGLIFNAGQNATITYGSNQTYNIIGGSINNSSTSLGLKAYASSVTFTDGASRNGNAATSSILADINAELASSPQPSSIALTNTSVIEGQNLVYTVSLSTPTLTGRPQVFTFSTSGTATKGSDFNGTYTFSNGVIDNGDGTITVPGSVSSFTITVSTIDDIVVESIENLIVAVGSKLGLGSIVDNDAPTAPNCDVNNPYDKIISGYHQSIAVKTDASFSVWGEDLDNTGAGSVLTPLDIKVANFPNLVGTPLKAAIGGQGGGGKEQAILLTSSGLFAWGNEGYVIDAGLTTSSTFAKVLVNNFTSGNVNVATGLPTGVNPYDVKMMTASYGTLIILTNSGDVWTLSNLSGNLNANGSSTASVNSWLKAKINSSTYLSGITAVRVQTSTAALNAVIALKTDGTVYTWGSSTYLGNGTASGVLNYATQMTLPAEFSITNIPKMIAVTGGIKNTSTVKNSLYILSNNGTLYSLGDNSKKQLGDFTSTERTSWVNAKINATTNFSNVSFITAQEHDASFPGVAIVTKTGDLYTWGENEGLALGRNDAGSTYTSWDPGMPLGFTSGSDIALSAEMGGHTLVYIKQGTTQFCYVGHKTAGSMGDGVSAGSFINTFNCSGTPSLSICGSVPVAASLITSTITANPNSIAANGTSTSIITVQLKQSNGTNLTTTGGVVVINTNKGSISNVTDNNDGTYTAILTSSTFVETASLTYTLNGSAGTNTASVIFTIASNPVITTTGYLKTFTSCSGCTVTPQSFTVSGVDLSTNNIVVTAPTGIQVSANINSGYASSINLTPSAGIVTTTTVYAKLTNNATTALSGTISVTSSGATAKTITVTTNTDNSLNFNGTSNAINIGQPITTGSSYTMEAWIKHEGNTTASNIISSYNNPFFISSNTLYAGVAMNYSVVTSPNTIPQNKWTHVAVSFDNATKSMILYVNGTQVSTGTAASGFTLSGAEPIYVGSHTLANFSPVSFFKGNIDEVRIWNTVRTPSEIQDNMFNELSGTESNLKAYYNFNQGTAGGTNTSIGTLTDKSTTANNASLSLLNLTGTSSNFVTGFIPDIAASGNATSLVAGGTLSLTNSLTGGVWSSSNTAIATVNTSSGLVTGVAGGTINISYTICSKTVTYNLTVLIPTITTTSLKTFTSCSGCTVTPQSFTVSGTNLGANVVVTAPAGFELSNIISGTYSSSLSLTPSAGSLASSSVYVRLVNNALTATNGNITVVSTGAVSKTITTTVNTDNAILLDGVDDYVNLGDVLDVNALPYTTEGWVYWKGSSQAFSEIFTKDVVQAVAITSANNLHANFGNGTIWSSGLNSTTLIPLNKWTHFAITRSNTGVVKMYINGVLDASTTTMNITGNNTAPRGIGAKNVNGSLMGYFNGAIDNLKIWNIEKSSTDISTNLYTELNGNESDLLAYYSFNQGVANGTNTSITTISDLTSNSNNGTLTNLAKTGIVSNFVTGFISEIAGASTIQKTTTSNYTNGLTGGVWTSAATSVATVDPITGVVSAISVGTSTITYTICNKTVSKIISVIEPTITTTGSLTAFSTCATTNSAAQTFTVSAQNLTTNLVLTAPAGYELSLSSGGTYTSTISIIPTSGTVSSTPIFIRTTNAIVNGQFGNINITSTGASTKTLATGNAVVTQNRTASVAISSNATNNTLCSSVSVTFTAIATNGGLTPAYQWKLNGNNITGANNATYITTSLANNDKITVVMGSSLSSCISGTPATSNEITMTVNTVPVTPGSITGANNICMNSNQVYSVNAVTGATSYTWVVTGDLIATPSTNNILNITAANNAGAGTIKVLATNTCGSSVYSAVYSVTVSNQPAPTASFTASGSNVCLTNAGVTFTSTSTPNATTSSNINTYAWTFGDGTTASTSTASNTYSVSGIFDAVLTITDANQCTSSISRRILVDPISVAGTALAAQATICEGTNTILSLTGYTGTIQWQSSTDGTNWNNITGANASTYTTANLTATTYYHAVVTSGACSTATSGVVTITVSPSPTVTLGVIANVYASATNFDINYTNPIGSPNEYSISTIAPNALPGFTAISGYGLMGSPISVPIPASAIGTYNFNLNLQNNILGCNSANIPFTLNVVMNPPAGLSYNTPNVYTTGTSITSLNPTSTGGPITTYSIGPSLPAGLTIDPLTGIISGTPSAVSTQTSYTVTGTNASGTVTATVVITVNAPQNTQPQGGINAVDYKLFSTDTVQIKLNIPVGASPFTVIIGNNKTNVNDTLTNVTDGSIANLKSTSTNTIYTLNKIIDNNGAIRTIGFTKDTTSVNIVAPNIALTLKADKATKQPDNSFKTKLLLKIKNSGEIDLKNVQVNANLSEVFPAGINYTLDSVRVRNGNVRLNNGYTGSGSATSPSSLSKGMSASSGIKSNAILDANYLFTNGVPLVMNEESDIDFYLSISPTSNNVTLKLQFASSGDGILNKSGGYTSQQSSTAVSDNGTNISAHPNNTNIGTPLPTYLPLFPIVSIGAALNASNPTIVTGGYTFDFIAKVKNFSNLNLDTVAIFNDFSKTFTSPDTAYIINTPIVTGGLVYNTNFNGYSNTLLIDSTAKLAVGDSATIKYTLFVGTSKISGSWSNSILGTGHSTIDYSYVTDLSTDGTNPDPNGDNDPLEQGKTLFYINLTPPAPPTVDNKIYIFGTTTPLTIAPLVKSYPIGTVPVWCNVATAICSTVAPTMPTLIGKYVYQLRSYDPTTKLYSINYVNDTVIIKPPVPLVNDSTYIIGVKTNPLNISVQVKGMTGSTLSYFYKTVKQNVVPVLGTVAGITNYTVSQTVNSIESDTASFKVTMLNLNDVIHLQKIAGDAQLQSNSTFNIPFTFVVSNLTNKAMDSVLVVDNLLNSVLSPSTFSIVSISSTGKLVANSLFNGSTDQSLSKYTSKLDPLVKDTIHLVMNLVPNGVSGILSNMAVAKAATPYGTVSISSSSNNNTAETVKSPTRYTIPNLAIDIPEGFSPNHDGVNDNFVIIKPTGTTLDLEIYNRWGNVVFYSANYNNEWNGKGTNNFIGQDLMDGGYYYTLKAKSITGTVQIFKGFVLIQR